jgi:hypothetical protein
MLTRSKLAIIAAALLGVAATTMAAQAQTIADPYPTTAPDRSFGLPSDPYPFGFAAASPIYSVRPNTVADLGRLSARSASRSQREARHRQRQLTATAEQRHRGMRRIRLVIKSGWY